LFSQYRDEEFAVEPRAGTLRVGFGQVAELRERLESLKGQFYLPADSVPMEDDSCTKSERLERREDNDVGSVLQRRGVEDLPVPGGVAPELLYCAFDRLLGFADCTQAPRNYTGCSVDVDRPFADLPSLP
jgi:hypothetical protein